MHSGRHLNSIQGDLELAEKPQSLAKGLEPKDWKRQYKHGLLF
jgi:hypothetical protein